VSFLILVGVGVVCAACAYHKRPVGNVCRSAIGNAVRDTRPLLEQDGRFPSPAPLRYRTATELLTGGTASRDTPTT
jgi:hypothetical protein